MLTKYYHGSSSLILDYIKPHLSFHLSSLTYLTTDYYYALVRCGKFEIDKFLIKEDYHPNNYTLVELEKDAFIKTFNSMGYIYTVEDGRYIHNESFMLNEYASCAPCEIQEVDIIPNVFEAILSNSNKYNLISYQESNDYWKTIRGGKEGYLKRREQRVQTINNKEL